MKKRSFCWTQEKAASMNVSWLQDMKCLFADVFKRAIKVAPKKKVKKKETNKNPTFNPSRLEGQRKEIKCCMNCSHFPGSTFRILVICGL